MKKQWRILVKVSLISLLYLVSQVLKQNSQEISLNIYFGEIPKEYLKFFLFGVFNFHPMSLLK